MISLNAFLIVSGPTVERVPPAELVFIVAIGVLLLGVSAIQVGFRYATDDITAVWRRAWHPSRQATAASGCARRAGPRHHSWGSASPYPYRGRRRAAHP